MHSPESGLVKEAAVHALADQVWAENDDDDITTQR